MKKPFLPYTMNATWYNRHMTMGVGGPTQRLYTPHNLWLDGNEAVAKPFQPGLIGLQTIVHEAEAAGKRVRAVGSGWSLSPAAFTDEYLVNTAQLTYSFVGFRSETMVNAEYRTPSRLKSLVFAQCGVQIRKLNSLLERQRLALSTSGASNGQTIAGAIATGTHGSNRTPGEGSIGDCILGIHIVGENGNHYWVERASKPVVTAKFCDWLGAELKREDDDLFNAILVSFGSFGLVHAVLLEPGPIFMLDRFVTQCDYATVKNAIRTLQLNGVPLPPGEAADPFHFEVVVNPYQAGKGGAFVRAYYKRPAPNPLPPPVPGDELLLLGDDLMSVIEQLTDALPDMIPISVQAVLKGSFKSTGNTFMSGPPGRMFGDSVPKPGGTSMEIGLAVGDSLGTAVDVILGAMKNFPIAAPAAFRYVSPSDALLSFTHFSPLSCTVEIPGIDSHRTRLGHEAIWTALKDSGIPHTYHWGQALPFNPHWVVNGFGQDRVNRWKAARRSFLSSAGRNMFANAMVVRCGLSEP